MYLVQMILTRSCSLKHVYSIPKLSIHILIIIVFFLVFSSNICLLSGSSLFPTTSKVQKYNSYVHRTVIKLIYMSDVCFVLLSVLLIIVISELHLNFPRFFLYSSMLTDAIFGRSVLI